MRQEITLHNVALDALDAAGQLGESRDGLFDALEFVIVEAQRRHDNGGRWRLVQINGRVKRIVKGEQVGDANANLRSASQKLLFGLAHVVKLPSPSLVVGPKLAVSTLRDLQGVQAPDSLPSGRTVEEHDRLQERVGSSLKLRMSRE